MPYKTGQEGQRQYHQPSADNIDLHYEFSIPGSPVDSGEAGGMITGSQMRKSTDCQHGSCQLTGFLSHVVKGGSQCAD